MPPTTPSPPQRPLAAYLDVDGTLTRTNIVGPLLYFRRRLMASPGRELWLATLPPRGLWWIFLDKLSREASNRAIYACYAGLSAARVRALAADCHREYFRPRLFPQARERLAALRAQGARLVLVTGSLDFLVQPLARELEADCIAPALEEREGVFTGRLTGPPLAGERKAEAMRAHAREHGIDLKESFALGDALGDLAMLEGVGHPSAVNPGRRLHAIARRRGWPVERWALPR